MPKPVRTTSSPRACGRRRRPPTLSTAQQLTAQGKENFATRTAALVIPAVGNNYRRHETLQRFMLANDSVTVAVEVPIWLTRADIQHLNAITASGFCPRMRRPTRPSPAISTFCRSATARCISSITTRRSHQSPVRAAHHLCPRAYPARRASPVRHQVRLVRGQYWNRGAKRKLALAPRRSGRALPHGHSAWSFPAIFVRPRPQRGAARAIISHARRAAAYYRTATTRRRSSPPQRPSGAPIAAA